MKNLIGTLLKALTIGTIFTIATFVSLSYYSMHLAIDGGSTVALITIYSLLRIYNLHKVKMMVLSDMIADKPLEPITLPIKVSILIVLINFMLKIIANVVYSFDFPLVDGVILTWIALIFTWHFYYNYAINNFYSENNLN